ncbi:MAG TPA: sigma-70 family RNA polymerase sigma factor [Thermoanaerobaculia bacterium]|nr:sigma-70 family RNA polymerase sigma factor [Thermoanaerobaculia bacterium]
MATIPRQERFLSLLDEHRKILYKVASSYCRNEADRQDLVQEIVVQLWRSFGRYDERLRFSTWTYRIALNVAISFYRSETRRTRHTVPAEGSILEVAADAPAPGEADDSLELLHGFIAQLDELDRALILLYLDGNRYDTIAEILGISETNVGTKISRIKQRLRRDFSRTN